MNCLLEKGISNTLALLVSLVSPFLWILIGLSIWSELSSSKNVYSHLFLASNKKLKVCSIKIFVRCIYMPPKYPTYIVNNTSYPVTHMFITSTDTPITTIHTILQARESISNSRRFISSKMHARLTYVLPEYSKYQLIMLA